VIGREDLLDDPRFASREARGEHEAEIDAMVSEWTRRHDKHEAMRLGEHNATVLGDWLGMKTDEVEALKRDGYCEKCELAGGDGDLPREWSAHGRS